MPNRDRRYPKGKCEICQVVCRSTCGFCRDAWYCGRSHQGQDWESHKKICLTKAEMEDVYHKTKMKAGLAERAAVAIGAEEGEQSKLQRAFVNDHPWPKEEQIRQFLQSPTLASPHFAQVLQAPGVYRHSLASRLYTATSMKSDKKRVPEWRAIGYLLYKRGGKEMMEWYFRLVCAVLNSTEFFWAEGERDPRITIWFFESMPAYWHGIGDFDFISLVGSL